MARLLKKTKFFDQIYQKRETTMRKLIIAVFLTAIVSLTAKASPFACRGILTNDFQNSGEAYFLDQDDYELRDFGNDHLAHAIQLIRILLDEQGCKPTDVNFGQGPLGRSKSRCEVIVPDRYYSRVCYVETNLGLFHVFEDFGTGVHLVFNQYD